MHECTCVTFQRTCMHQINLSRTCAVHDITSIHSCVMLHGMDIQFKKIVMKIRCLPPGFLPFGPF